MLGRSCVCYRSGGDVPCLAQPARLPALGADNVTRVYDAFSASIAVVSTDGANVPRGRISSGRSIALSATVGSSRGRLYV